MPGMKIEDVFKRVRTEVRSKSNGSQIPEERSSLEGDFYFSRGSMVVEEPPTAAAVREPETGKLTVKSNVGGAKVYINRADRGVEPVSATLNPGEYSIILKKEGYSDAFDTVRVEAGSAKTINVVMEKPAPPPMIEPPQRPATATIDNTFTSPTLETTFALIPAGTFMMGSPNGESGDRDETLHQVTISKPFYMQTTEVTQGQWQKVMGHNPSRFNSCGNDCPVEQVSWNAVQEFIGKLNGMERTDRYRLPTEAQWEYAARAGTTTPFNTGSSCLETDQANYDGSYPLSGCSKGEYRQKTVRVGSFAPNPWGLYDMHGNVMEWVQDVKGDYLAASITDPEGPAWGTHRVIRGGSWDNLPSDCRSARRVNFVPGSRSSLQGFRLLSTVAVSDSPSVDKPPPVSGAIETGRDVRFIANSNGTVLDTRTNLMWAAKDNGSDINWANAKSYSENYRGGGYTDWRMPTQDELEGLYDKAQTYKSGCSYDVHLTELIRLTCTASWASETRGSDAAFFSFITAKRVWNLKSYSGDTRALPVRSAK